jgi:DNA-binding LacI/PurR family transcriptional regulator
LEQLAIYAEETCFAHADLGNSRAMKTPGNSSRRRKASDTREKKASSAKPIRLKELAKRLNLSPTTLSLVLNRAPAAQAIPKATKERIFAAAEGLNYRPNLMARSLRSQRTYSIGVLVPEFSDGYSATVLSGIEEVLLREGYIYLVTTHRHKPQVIDRNSKLLYERRVEGLIAVDTPYDQHLPLPVVSVSGHKHVPGVTNIVLNHRRAAEAALGHLAGLGHTNIAFLQGQEFSSDTSVRWEAIRAAAKKLGLKIHPQNVAQLTGDTPSPEPGYVAARKLMEGGQPFTALFAFNDTSAIGAVRALREAGWHIPRDISIVGFDDVSAAAFHNPALTTIRQPLWRMGVLAAENLLERIVAGKTRAHSDTIHVEAELIVRESTAEAAGSTRRRRV